MTTRFNKDMYAKMRSKKDEPLSSLRKKVVRVTGKSPSVTPVTSATLIVSAVKTVRTASLATSVEEIPTPSSKRLRVSGKEKEKADSHPSTVWSNEGLAVDQAHGLVTIEDMKVLNGVSFNVVANQQVHKLVQVIRSYAFLTALPRAGTDELTLSWIFSRFWARAYTLLLSILLRRLRWRRWRLGWRFWKRRTRLSRKSLLSPCTRLIL